MFAITKEAPDRNALIAGLSSPYAGGLATFEGWVRNHNEGRDVVSLEYECYEDLAIKEGEKVIAEAKGKFGVLEASCVHRIGRLSVGEVAVWVGVAGRHRQEAFQACRYIIDEIKKRLPIWKKEFYADGTTEWVNCSHHEQSRFADANANAHSGAERQTDPAQDDSTCAPGASKFYDKVHSHASAAHAHENEAVEENDPSEYALHWHVLKSRSPRELTYVDIREDKERSVDQATKKLLTGRSLLEWPLSLLDLEKVKLESNLTYLFFCQRGKRSSKLVHELRARGHKNVFSLSEGVEGMSVAKDSIKV